MILSKKSGTTLVEVMIASGILSAVFSAMLFMVTFALTQQNQIVTLTTKEKLFQSISADLRADSAIYQKNFAPPLVATSTILATANLPFRWGTQVFCEDTAGTNCCPNCEGQLGYVIRPINGYPGMFMTTVRMVHPKLNNGEEIYEFIMSPR